MKIAIFRWGIFLAMLTGMLAALPPVAPPGTTIEIMSVSSFNTVLDKTYKTYIIFVSVFVSRNRKDLYLLVSDQLLESRNTP